MLLILIRYLLKFETIAPRPSLKTVRKNHEKVFEFFVDFFSDFLSSFLSVKLRSGFFLDTS